ncbi:MAG TPA: hypothetical protein VE987_22855, partial [Polyangiaceae bacterium]|nr:hypothetical protein [Polyangiaceae bacterium]
MQSGNAELAPEVVAALREAGVKIGTAARRIATTDGGTAWLHRLIYGEIAQRAEARGPAYWDRLFPGMPPERRAERRVRRMLARSTVAGIAAAGGMTAAELFSVADIAAAPVA